MSRLASIAKAGYYPTPENIVELLAQTMVAPAGGRVLDPCAGQGELLLPIAKKHLLTPHAIELQHERGQLVASHMRQITKKGQTLICDVQAAEASPQAFQCLLLNPPYDHDKDDGRLELTFLKHTTPWLQSEGLLIYIVPRHVLARPDVLGYLLSEYDHQAIFKFPEPEYEVFKQVIFMGQKRPFFVHPFPNVLEICRDTILNNLEDLSLENLPVYHLPAPNQSKIHFARHLTNLQDALADAADHGLQTHSRWQSHLRPTAEKSQFRPLMPLKIGHLQSLVAGGFVNNQLLTHPQTGEKLLVKGSARKESFVQETEQELNDRGDKQITRTTKQRPTTELTILEADGTVKSLSKEEVIAFLQKWVEELGRAITDSYRPLYQMEKGELYQQIGDIGHLYPAQKQMVCALLTRLKTHKEAFLSGEMGTGKTRMGAAVARGLQAKRTLILCPPHLIQKWQREAEMVYPEAHIMTLKTITDVNQWMSLDENAQPQIGLMKFTTARAGSGWRPAYLWWELFTPQEQKLLNAYQYALANGHPLPTLPEKLHQLKHLGKPLYHYFQKWINLMGRRGVRQPDSGHILRHHQSKVALHPDDMQDNKPYVDTSAGAAPHWRSAPHKAKGKSYFGAYYQHIRGTSEGSFAEYVKREKQIREGNTSFYAQPKGGRWPLASYIHKKFKGRIELILADECHQLKGDSSDQGFAFHRLVCASQKVVAMTGTLYGGKASSLFDLLWRTSSEVRKAFIQEGQSGKRRIGRMNWMQEYGLLEWVEKKQVDGFTGKQTTNKRESATTQEAPGTTPHMLKWVLDKCAFLALQDLGHALPDYREIAVAIPPSQQQQMQLEAFDKSVGQEMRERMARGDRSLLGAYLHGCISWPDAPFRPEIVVDPHTKTHEKPTILFQGVAAAPEGQTYLLSNEPLNPRDPILYELVEDYPACLGLEEYELDDLATVQILENQPIPVSLNRDTWPKEERILQLIQAEVKQKRGVLLLIQQTNTRDIQPHWQALLKARGISSAILKAEADQREAWLKEQEKLGTQVIITHPRKVETGLDIMHHQTIIWQGTEFSTYTILQASRRAWRIGQKKACKVYFFYYQNTLQELAMNLIARKCAAALRVNGDILDSRHMADMDDGDSIEAALGKMVLEGEINFGSEDLQSQLAVFTREVHPEVEEEKEELTAEGAKEEKKREKQDVLELVEAFFTEEKKEVGPQAQPLFVCGDGGEKPEVEKLVEAFFQTTFCLVGKDIKHLDELVQAEIDKALRGLEGEKLQEVVAEKEAPAVEEKECPERETPVVEFVDLKPKPRLVFGAPPPDLYAKRRGGGVIRPGSFKG